MIELLSYPNLDGYSFSNKELKYAEEVLENQLMEYFDSPFVVLTSSATAAIHIALILTGIKKGDTVLTSNSSFVATVHPILYQQAKPLFIDITPNSWQIDLEKTIQTFNSFIEKPKGIIIPNNYGSPFPYYEEIKKLNIPVIEDNAAGIGSTLSGKKAGTLGDLGVISFNSNKLISGLGGGALLLKKESDYLKAKQIIQHGRDPEVGYSHNQLGYNYKIQPLSALTISKELLSIESKITQKKEVNNFYKSHLEQLGFKFQSNHKGSISNNWLNVIYHEDFSLESTLKAIELLKMNGIECRKTWYPLNQSPHLSSQNHKAGFRNSVSFFNSGLCLPSSLDIQKNDIEKTCSILIKSFST